MYIKHANYKKPFYVFIWLLLLILPLYSRDSLSRAPISLDWAFIYQQGNGLLKTIDYSAPFIDLATGSKIKFMFRFTKPGYLYFLLIDSTGRLQLIYPEKDKISAASPQLNRGIYLPPGSEWYFLEEPGGVEEFYLVVSAIPLDALEQSLTAYLDLTSVSGNSNKVQDAAGEVLGLIRTYRQQYSQWLGAAEKPVPLAGIFRILEETAGGLAVQITGQGFYAKTIRIRH